MLKLVHQSQYVRVSTLELVRQSQYIRVNMLELVRQSQYVRVSQLDFEQGKLTNSLTINIKIYRSASQTKIAYPENMEEYCKALSVLDFRDYIQSHFLLCVILDCHHYIFDPNCNQEIQSCRRWFCARKLSCFLRTMATPSVFCSLFQCHMLQSSHCTRVSTQTSNNQLK